MNIVLINTLISLVIVWLIGAWFIGDAVRAFQKRKYFLFGLNIMLAIHEVLMLILAIFFSEWLR